jgi:tmRNA-binding protein
VLHARVKAELAVARGKEVRDKRRDVAKARPTARTGAH